MSKKKRGGGARKFFAFLGVLSVVVLGGAVALRMILTPERLRAAIVDAATNATGLDVRLEDAQLSFVPFGVSLQALRLEEDDGTPFLELASGLVRLELVPLLQKTVVVSRLTLRQPRLRLRQEGGEIVLPGTLGEAAAGAGSPASAGRKAGATFQAVVESFEIVDGSFRLETPDHAEDVTVDGIGLAGSLDIEPGGTSYASKGKLSLSGLSLAALDAYRETLDTLRPVIHYDVAFRSDRGSLHLEEVRLVADPLDLRFHGDIHGLPDAAEIALALDEQTLELAELLPLIPPALIPEGRTPTASGPVTVSAKFAGPLGKEEPPAFTAQVRFGGADLGLEGFAAGVTQVEGAVTATADRLEFTDLSGRLGDGSFALTGTVEGWNEPAGLRYDVAIRGELDLSLAASAGFLPEGADLAGNLEVDVAAKGAGSAPEQVELTGAVRLREGRYRSSDLPVPVHGLEGSLRLAGPTVELEKLRGSLGRSAFSVAGEIRGVPAAPKIRMTGRAALLDLAELAPAAEPGALAAAGTGGTPAPLVPPLPPFDWNLRLAIDSLVTVGGNMTGVELTAAIRDRKARVDTNVDVADFDGVVLSGLAAGVDIAGQTVRGDFHSPRVHAHRVPLTGVRGLIELGDDKVLHLDAVRAGVWTGRVEGKASIDLTRPGEPAFDIETSALDLEANDFMTALTPADDVLFGKLDISSRFKGRGSTPNEIKWGLTGEGTVATRRGRLAKTKTTSAVWQALHLGEKGDIPFQDMATSFSIENGRLYTRDLAMTGSDADWTVSGFITFEGAIDYDVEVVLSEALSHKFRRRVGADIGRLLSNGDERLILDLKVTGAPGKRPDVAVDYDKMGRRALDRGVEEIGDKITDAIGGLFKKR